MDSSSSASSLESSSMIWKPKPGASRRRIKYWLKHSLIKHEDIIFEETESDDDENDDAVKDAGHDQTNDSHFDDHVSHDNDDEYTCHNIDEAMKSLHGFCIMSSQHSDKQQQDTGEEYEYDWILDGDPEWAEEVETSLQLQQSLCQLELEDMHFSDNDDLLKMGDQNLKFANFEDDFLSSPEKDLQDENTSSSSSHENNDEDEEFGDFITAQQTLEDESDTDTKQESNVHASLEQNLETGITGQQQQLSSAADNAVALSSSPIPLEDSPSNNPMMETTKRVLKPPFQVQIQRTPYDFLPLQDVSTPEGRFIRKRQLDSTKKQSSSSFFFNDNDDDVTDSDNDDTELPKEYYDESFDGTLQILNSIPWENVLFWQSPETWPSHNDDDEAQEKLYQVEDYLTRELSELDTSKASISSKLIQQIQKHETMMEDANQVLHDMDHNLTMADMYVHRGRDVVARAARGSQQDGNVSGLINMGTLLDDFNKRDLYQQLQYDLNRIDALLETETIIHTKIKSFGIMMNNGSVGVSSGGGGPSTTTRHVVDDIIQLATQLRKDVTTTTSITTTTTTNLSRLVAFNDFRQRACTLLDVFHNHLHMNLIDFVGRCCCSIAGGFSNSQYEVLVCAMLDIQSNTNNEEQEIITTIKNSNCSSNNNNSNNHGNHKNNSVEEKKDSEKEGDFDVDHDTTTTTSSSSSSYGDEWADCILNALCYQADKCFARALLDPIILLENNNDEKMATLEESEYEKELIHLQYELNNDNTCQRPLSSSGGGNGHGHDHHEDDVAKLQTLIHNLVTIRFDFELKQRNYLPCVYHTLCQLLTDVLHTHYILTQWHKMPFDERNNDIRFLHRRQEEQEGQQSDGEGHDTCSHQDRKISDHPEELGRITYKLEESRLYLWKHCESVLVRCLDEYLSYATKNKIFQKSEDGTSYMNGDATSVEYAEGLQYIMMVTKQFLALGDQFVSLNNNHHHQFRTIQQKMITSLEPNSEHHSDLRDRLQDLCQKYLRTLHVEAMNSMGNSLYNETWQLLPVGVDKDNIKTTVATQDGDSDVTSCQSHFKTFMVKAISQSVPARNPRLECWENQLNKNVAANIDILSNYVDVGNPFVMVAPQTNDETKQHITTAFEDMAIAICDKLGFRDGVEISLDDTSTFETDLYSMIAACSGSNGLLVGTESATKELVHWCCKLLLAMHRLPLIRGDVDVVFSNIFDLYFTTVLRICAGNANHENVILGAIPATGQSQDSTESNLPIAPNNSTVTGRRNPPTSGFFGRQKNRPRRVPRQTPTISPHTAADICAPLPCDMAKIAELRKFILRGHASLDGIVNLELTEQWLPNPIIPSTGIDDQAMMMITTALQKRAGAAWSCLFVGILLDFVGTFVREAFESSENFDNTMPVVETTEAETKNLLSSGHLVSLLTYVESAADIAPSLIRIGSRISCVRAILSREIVQQIIQVDWDVSTLNEHSNSYVDQLSIRCARLWNLLCTSEKKLPRGVLNQVWSDTVSGAYLALLEGFSKILQCSTEGRALMSMDLASFSSGISPSSIVSDHPGTDEPPMTMPQRGMQYVDTYIKVYYYPEEDVMNWVAQNHRTVQLQHSLALVFATSENDDQDLLERINTVKKLYEAAALAHA